MKDLRDMTLAEMTDLAAKLNNTSDADLAKIDVSMIPDWRLKAAAEIYKGMSPAGDVVGPKRLTLGEAQMIVRVLFPFGTLPQDKQEMIDHRDTLEALAETIRYLGGCITRVQVDRDARPASAPVDPAWLNYELSKLTLFLRMRGLEIVRSGPRNESDCSYYSEIGVH